MTEERSLRVFESGVLRILFGPKRDKVTEKWRKLHNEELNDLSSSLSIIHVIKSRRMRGAVIIACIGEGRNAYRVLVGKPEGKRSLGRPWHRWGDNIKIDLQEVDGGEWSGLICLRTGAGSGHL